MKVFKFGGGSVKDAEGVKQLTAILQKNPDNHLIVIISAIGKTTNLMEQLLDAYYHHPENVQPLLQKLKENHETIARELDADTSVMINAIAPLFESLEAILSHPPSGNYDYDYDQIVSFGELLATTLISTYLTLKGIRNLWEDARRLVRTDRSHREGRVQWETTTPLINNRISELFEQAEGRLIITQGFIGGTEEGNTTTLGREGSDYSASIFGFSLDVESVTIWKDVPGFFNADPKEFPQAVKLDAIPYEEAIELSYYGATIIHPKTLKPLQNKQIPLHVKHFFAPEESGSTISSLQLKKKIPSYIFKKNQLLISIFPKDFSFINVNNLSEIFNILAQYKIAINLMQNSALSFSLCIDHHPSKTENLLNELNVNYAVKYNAGVELATVRHYDKQSLKQLTEGWKILIEQRNRTTIQIVRCNGEKRGNSFLTFEK